MPYSDFRLRPNVLSFFNDQRWAPETVLDVGCGAGSNLDFYKPWWPKSKWTALEVWQPYIAQFSLFHRYDALTFGDVRQLPILKFDLVIFGDVLEHMPKEDSKRVLDTALRDAKYVLVALPVVHYPQGALEGNPYEEHVSEWTYNEFAELDECRYAVKNDVTGSFVLTRQQ